MPSTRCRARSGLQKAQQILQGLDSIAFSRSQVLLQVDTFQGLGGSANADRLLFNPQLVFGHRNAVSLQLKAPVLAVYPYAPEAPREDRPGRGHHCVRVGLLASERSASSSRSACNGARPLEPPVGAGMGGDTELCALPWHCPMALASPGNSPGSVPLPSSGYPELNVLLARSDPRRRPSRPDVRRARHQAGLEPRRTARSCR